ncbi:MAG TPA: carbohydrate-binding domain-containing protein, partial [Bacteroidales bacterium]
MFVKRVLIGFLVFLAVIISSLFLLPPFLGKSKPVSSNLLVVEGWVSDNAMAQAADQIRSGNYSMIVTTGGPTPEDVEMLYNGYIVIKCANLPIQNFKEITVEAFGDKGGNENAHFKLLVDNRMVGETYVSKKLQPYKFNVPDGINRIDSVTVVFDNDYFVSKSDDRNLYIRSIVIGNKEISARSDRNYLVNNGVKT